MSISRLCYLCVVCVICGRVYLCIYWRLRLSVLPFVFPMKVGSLNGEYLRLEHAIREWVARDLAPKIHDFDRPPVGAVLDGLKRFGPLGADAIPLGLLCEELEYVDTALRVILSDHVAATIDGGAPDQVRRFTAAAGATGLIRASRDASMKHVSERPAPPQSHQLIAGMESDYQVARALWLRSAELKNGGRPCRGEIDLGVQFCRSPPRRGPPATPSRSTAPTATRMRIPWAGSTATTRR